MRGQSARGPRPSRTGRRGEVRARDRRYAGWFTELDEHYPGIEREHTIKGEPPLPAVTDNEETIKDWIRREAWGHHACGTCRMGPPGDNGAVLDSRFRVGKVDGLRVVDASIFPRIPGYFIVANIYMASEKAAEVIIADANSAKPDASEYPHALRELEREAISTRRKAAAIPMPEPLRPGHWPEDVAGLALSGGGVRSATFNLGVIQALASAQWLRRVDFLSTVSGGGYIGTFLGRWYDRLRPQAWGGVDSRPDQPSAGRVERELTDPDSPAISWLRKHGNYLAPRGAGDAPYYSAVFLRSFLSVHFVVALLLFSAFGAIDWIRYAVLEPGTAFVGLFAVTPGDFPIGHVLQAVLGAFYSPWFMAFELILLFMVVPRIVAYWIVSQDHHKRYAPVPLLAMLVGSGLVLYAAVGATFRFPILLIGIAPLISLIHVELAWRRGRVREDAIGRGNVETQRLRTRNILTDDLGTALVLAGAALAFSFIDTIGHGLQQYVAKNEVYLQAFAAFGAALATLNSHRQDDRQLHSRRRQDRNAVCGCAGNQEADFRRSPCRRLVRGASGVCVVRGPCGLSGRSGRRHGLDGNRRGFHHLGDSCAPRRPGLRQSIVANSGLCRAARAGLSRRDQSATVAARGSEHRGGRGRGRRCVDPRLPTPLCWRPAARNQHDGQPDRRLHLAARQPESQG